MGTEIIYFAIILFFASIICLALAMYILQHQNVFAAIPLSLFLLGVSLINLCYGLELMTFDLSGKYFWIMIRYLGYTLEFSSMPFFILWYTGFRSRTPRWVSAIFIGLPVLAYLAILTNDLHHLYYASIWLDTSGPIPLFAKQNGPIYLPYQAYTILIGLGFIIFMIYTFIFTRQTYRVQTLLMIIGLIFPLIFGTLYVAGIRPFYGINLTPFSYLLTGLLFSVAVIRYQASNLRPVALNLVFDIIPSGILILNEKNLVSEMNRSARRIISPLAPVKIGQPLEVLCADWPELAKAAKSLSYGETTQVVRTLGGQTFYYSVGLEELLHADQVPMGRVIMIRDISIEHEARQKQFEQQRALAILDERERLARDLHDSLGQVMGYFNVETQNALQYLKNDQVDLSQATMQRLVEISQGAYADLREFLLGMRQKFSETVDFYASLEKYVHDFSLAYGQKVEVHLPPVGERPDLEPFAEVQLLRVIQESLSNIRKHAHASLATISFSNSPESIQVVIEDDGAGFDLAKIKSVEADENPHFGLSIMQERAEDIGGRLEIQSSPGRGTRVIVRLLTTPAPKIETQISSLRVLVADDHPLFLDGLKNLLVARGVRVVATASNGQEAVQQALELQPDVAILDIQMPLVTGIEAARRIKSQAPNIRVLMLTISADDNTLFEAIRAGASGYLLKDLNADEFLARLEGLMRGETPISPGLAERLLSEFSGGSQGESEYVQFNERQMEILTLMAQRYTYAQIAQRLYLSESTIKYHAAQIMDRLHSKSKDEALVEAARRGLIERRKPGR